MKNEFESSLAKVKTPVLAVIKGDKITFQETPETSKLYEMDIGDLFQFVTEYIAAQKLPHGIIKWVLQETGNTKNYPVAYLYPEDANTIGIQIQNGEEIVGKIAIPKKMSVEAALMGLFRFIVNKYPGLLFSLPELTHLKN